MRKILLIGLVLLLTMVTGVYAADFPKRNITLAVVWGAGGGTDTCNRIIAAEMKQFIGVNINVINKTGGVGGSVGMMYGYSRPHDGYTLTGLSESNVTAGVQGGWDKNFNVWDVFIVGGSPDIISVTPNSPYQSLKDLIEAAKSKPGSIRAGASAAGSIHHLNLLALEHGSGAKFNFIPYKGSAPSQNAAMAGEVTVVVTSLAEQQQLLRGGKLRPLAMLIPEPFKVEGLGTIPSSFDSYPGLSKAVIVDAFNKAMATEKVKSWAKANYYLLSGKTGAESRKIFDALQSNFAWTLWELKAAKVDPASLGIPKP